MDKNLHSSRDLFKKILNIENNFECIDEARKLCGFYSTFANTLPQYINFPEDKVGILSPRELSQLFIAHFPSLEEPIPNFSTNTDVIEFILKQYAPRALLHGCLLQNVSNASNCHELVVTILHRIHSVQVGSGNFLENKNILFRQMLESIGINLPNVASSFFSESDDILEESFIVPTCYLSLSLFPDEMLPEILGITLFDMKSNIPHIIRKLQEAIVARNGLTTYYQGNLRINDINLIENARLAIEAYLSMFDSIEKEERKKLLINICNRINNGIKVAHFLQKKWTSNLIEFLSLYLSAHQKMVRMIEQKSKYAIGYHSHLKLDGINFDSVISGNAETFVEKLGKSRWVSPGDPEKSALSTKLVKFGGPMFRVFSPDELRTINEWIISLPNAINHEECTREIKSENIFTTNKISILEQGNKNILRNRVRYKKKSLRDMYFHLVNIERYPEMLFYAKKFAENWLVESSLKMSKDFKALLFQEYSYEKLQYWYESQAKMQVESYSQLSHEIQKNRDQVIDEAIQLCPMVLVDGAWLQKYCTPGLIDTKIGSLLYKIYSDEVGNGDVELNHPNIYRDLMREMGVNLPKFGTKEFAYWERFEEDAFQVPVFWLSISQFPRRFMPEILGLNLAMELSGVGGAYRTARDELHHYGYSTRFVDLHNTIDNVSTGHSAMALQAIGYHMDEIIQKNSKTVLREQWGRVWTGYRALVPPKNSWKTLFFKNKKYPD